MSPTCCRHLRTCLFLISVMSLHSAALAVGADEPVPKDFRIVAHYYPGYSGWSAWQTTITADGKAVQKKDASAEDEREWEKAFALSPGDIKALASRIETSRFTKLKKRYAHPVTDNPTLSLRVTSNEKTHEVDVYAPSFQRDDAEVQRFLAVWVEVLEKVPSPNRGDSPKHYRP